MVFGAPKNAILEDLSRSVGFPPRPTLASPSQWALAASVLVPAVEARGNNLQEAKPKENECLPAALCDQSPEGPSAQTKRHQVQNTIGASTDMFGYFCPLGMI